MSFFKQKQCLTASLCMTISACFAPTVFANSIPQLTLAPSVTVSGLSSGGYMAAQYHLAHAEQVSGAAILAAGPVYCAQNSLITALTDCLNKDSSAPDLVAIEQYISTQRQHQKLAPTEQLQNDRVWIFHGSKDTTVYPKLGALLYQQYQQWIAPQNIVFINDKPFAHTFPTDRSDLGSCDVSESPFLASCGYDAAGALLTHLLGSVQTKSAKTTGTMFTIEQPQSAAAGSSLANSGYLYVPTSCASGAACRLHVSFHGCKQNAEMVDDAFINGTGLNNYADTNKLVILYPQTKKSSVAPLNPSACWDWWGATGEDYATRSGQQIDAVYQLIKTLQGGK